MKEFFYNGLYMVLIAFGLFFITIGDLLNNNPNIWNNYFAALHWWGKLTFILFIADFIWIIYSQNRIR